MVDRELQALRAMLSNRPADPGTIEMRRAGFARMAAQFALPNDVEMERTAIGHIPCTFVRTADAREESVVYYLHGGAYGMGGIETHGHWVSRLARAANIPVFALDYRLAPEFPAPAAIEDAFEGFAWLVRKFGHAKRIVMVGDSAGAGLCLATMIVARERGYELPAGCVCVSPWTDLAMTGKSIEERASLDPIVNPRLLASFAQSYLAGADPRDPHISPLYADLGGLPPLLIMVGTAEVLFDDAQRIAERARAAGVTVTFEAWQDMVHIWPFFAPILSEGQRAIERMAEFIRDRADHASLKR